MRKGAAMFGLVLLFALQARGQSHSQETKQAHPVAPAYTSADLKKELDSYSSTYQTHKVENILQSNPKLAHEPVAEWAGKLSPLAYLITSEELCGRHVGALMDVLLKHGASPNVPGPGGSPVLFHHARWAGHCFDSPRIFEALSKAGADVRAKDSSQNTLLHLASHQSERSSRLGAMQRLHLVRAMLRAGIDVTARNAAGATALDIAQQALLDFDDDSRQANAHRHVLEEIVNTLRHAEVLHAIRQSGNRNQIRLN